MNLPEYVQVVNSSGVNDGLRFVQYNEELRIGDIVEVVIQYAIPNNRAIPLNIQIQAEAVLPIPTGDITGSIYGFIRSQNRLADGRYHIVFGSVIGVTYYLQYTLDGANWHTALPGIRATNRITSWIDGRHLPIGDAATLTYRVLWF